jgi:predicted metal-dependent hydrolase
VSPGAAGGLRAPALAVPLRRIALSGVDVDYRLVRAKRRTIGMQIGTGGLVVRASRWVTLREIEAALTEHAAWILRRLAEWRARRRDTLPEAWTTGAPLLVQGRDLTLAIVAAPQPAVAADLVNVVVRHPAPHDEDGIAATVTGWLHAEALALLLPHAIACAARIGAAPPAVRLSNARAEWGSCNRDGVIRLSWRLVQLPPELSRYVVAHEVAHLRELNHSPQFWALVESLHPGHRTARRALAEWSAVLD